jgi:hypothetical protein
VDIEHRRYMQSKKWKTFREQNIDNKCYCCGSKTAKLNLHHITYDRLYNELPEDVVTVCTWCHRDIHKFIEDKTFLLSVAHIKFKQLISKPKKSYPSTKDKGFEFNRKTSNYKDFLDSHGYDTYTDYMQSDFGLRLYKFLQDKCFCCNKKVKKFHITHQKFNNFGNETIEDVVTVCYPCLKDIRKYRNMPEYKNKNIPLTIKEENEYRTKHNW